MDKKTVFGASFGATIGAAIGTAALVAAIAFLVDTVKDNRVAEARVETRLAIAYADSVLQAKNTHDDSVRVAIARAEIRERAATRAIKAADSANEDYTRLRAQLASIESIPVVDSALNAADSVIADLQFAVESQIQATADLKVALDIERAAHEKTTEALTRVSASATKLADATKPPLFSRLLPRFGVGAAVGVDPSGRPNAVVGLTLSFR